MYTKGQAVGQRLTALRDDAGLTNAELAERTGLNVGTVRGVLDGSVQCPTIQTMRAMAVVLPVSIDALIAAAVEDGCAQPTTRSLDDVADEAKQSLADARRAIEGYRNAEPAE